MARDRGTDGDTLCVVGIKPRNGRRAKHTEDGHIHRYTDVHGTRVRRDEEDAAAKQSREDTKADLPRKDV